MNFAQKLDRVLDHYASLKQKLESHHDNPLEFIPLTKEYSDLTPLADAILELRKAEQNKQELSSLLKEENLESDLKEMAHEELITFDKILPELEQKIKVLLLPKDKDDERNVILEIRAGTGGEEAGLFGANLFRMYKRYAEIKGWRFETLDLSETGIGGIKEARANISGYNVFARLKFESGVHRVQRVPETESSGRIHTSAATVAILPEPKEVDVVLEDKDIRIDVFRSSGPGGQSVNTTDSAVRITHIPTGIVVQQQDEKSQHKNKAKALKILRARIYEKERERQDLERSQNRKSQIGSGDRSERIRTYNYPQGRLTDHRINLTLYKLAQILEGTDLDEVIEPLIAEDQAKKLTDFSDV